MKWHEENTQTTKTRVVTTNITIKTDTTVRRIGTKTPKVLTRRRMTRKNPRTRNPAGFDKNIFACACRMIQEKVDSARQAGITDIKSVNAVKKDNFMHIFNFREDVYDSAWAQATGEEDPGASGNLFD